MYCLQKIVAFEKKRWIKPALSGEDALIWGAGIHVDCKNTGNRKRIQDHIEAKRSKKMRLVLHTYIYPVFER
jgi:hypothetical protein